MRFDDLLAFVTERMRMSHIYQPLLIRALVDAGGAATLRRGRFTILRARGRRDSARTTPRAQTRLATPTPSDPLLPEAKTP